MCLFYPMITINDKLKTAWLRQLHEDWKTANFLYFHEDMRPPNYELAHSGVTLGRWKGGCHRRLSISIVLINTYSWEYVQEVLYHEMVHQYVEEILGICEEVPHGEAFRRVCQEKGIDPTATGDLHVWMEKRGSRCTVSSGNHQILDKVHKLLALAQSPNEHEAQTAMTKAHELLLRYNLSLLDTQTKGNYLHKQIGEIGRRDPAKSTVSAILCKYFFVEVIWTFGYDQHRNRRGRVLEIYGAPENVEMAEYVYHYLLNVSELLWKEYKGKNMINGNRHRRTFIYGLLEGFYHKLEDSGRENVSQKLVWKGDPQLREYYQQRNPRRTRASSRYSRTCQNAYNSGVFQGKKLIIHKGIRESGDGEVRYLN
ncbi:MAG: SprT-like family protein [Candidatus Brocadia fulgida]|uniref:SprT-like family protein n=1 Tax=Candidatus Brocadia fulgida TaxID=380242 RepID=A0A0M2USK3_9BACT|nr:MAG: SprT-like family protein [Candidatus Brocadia fulgida]